jgi:methyl-accepting chemotaxis protein
MSIGIRAKLFAGISGVLVLLTAVAGIGLVKLNEVGGNASTIGQKQLPAVAYAYDAKVAITSMQRDLRQGILINNVHDTEWQKSFAAADKQFADDVVKLKDVSSTPESQKRIDTLVAVYDSWAPTRKQVFDLTSSGAVDAGRAVLLSDANVKAVQAINASLDDFIAYRQSRADTQIQSSNDAIDQARLLIGASVALAVALGLGLAFFLSRSVSNGVRDVQRVLTSITNHCAKSLENGLAAMANSDLSVEAVAVTKPIARYGKDEVGQTAAVTNTLLASIQNTIASYESARAGLSQLVSQVQRAAEGVAQSSSQLGAVSEQTGAAVQQVSRAVQNVAAGAGEASRGAQETNAAVSQLGQAIEAIARGAAEQARQIQGASATATALGATVEQVASSAQAVDNASQVARTAAERGGSAVQETTAAMGTIQGVVNQAVESVAELGKLSERIGAVVETIDDIAEQTNLLALNAAIEAARAGEHGKGFAVVADEVRKLAERSSRETKQIAELIRQVQSGTQHAVDAMQTGAQQVESGTAKAKRAGEALGEILASVEDTARQATEIAAAVQHMAASSGEVTEAMTSISAVVEESTAATEEMSAQAGQVTSAIANIAAVAEEQSAATEEVSASSEEMTAQVEQMSAQAQQLASTAKELRELVAQFRLAEAPAPASNVIPLRRSAA